MNEILETNQAIIRRLFGAVWDQGNFAVLDEIIDPDGILHDPNPTLNGARGLACYRQWLGASRSYPFLEEKRTFWQRAIEHSTSSEKENSYEHEQDGDVRSSEAICFA